MQRLSTRLRNWLDQVSKFNLAYFAKNSPLLFASKLIATGFGFLLTYIFTRYAAKQVYGQYQYIVSVLALVSLFSLPGVNTAIIQSAARGFDGVLREGTRLRLKSALIGSAALLLVACYFLLKNEQELFSGLLVAAGLFPMYYGLDTFLAFLNGKQKFLPFSITKSLIFSVSAVVTAFVVLLDFDLWVIILARLGIASLLNLVCFWLTQTKYVENKMMDEGAMSYGKHTSVIGVIGTIHYNLSSLVVGTFLGFEDLAVFSVGNSIRRELQNLMSIYYAQITPKLAAKSDRGAFNTVIQSSKYTILILALVCLLVIAALPIVIPLIFTPEYNESILYAQLLVLGTFVAFPGGQFVIFMIARKKVPQRYMIQLALILVEVIFLLILTRPFGILGIVLAKLVANLFYSCYSWWLSRRSIVDEQGGTANENQQSA